MACQPSLHASPRLDDDDEEDGDIDEEEPEVEEDEEDDDDEEVWQVRLTAAEEIPTLAGLFDSLAGVRHDRVYYRGLIRSAF
jgi:hypothetical protein